MIINAELEEERETEMKIHGIKTNSLKHDNDIPLMDGSKNPLLKVNYNSDKLALSYIFLPVMDLVFHEETKKTLFVLGFLTMRVEIVLFL